MDGPHGLGLGQAQQVVVAAHVPGMIRETGAAEVGLAVAPLLEHCAHRTIEHHDSLRQQRGQRLDPGGPGQGRAGGGDHGALDATAASSPTHRPLPMQGAGHPPWGALLEDRGGSWAWASLSDYRPGGATANGLVCRVG